MLAQPTQELNPSPVSHINRKNLAKVSSPVKGQEAGKQAAMRMMGTQWKLVSLVVKKMKGRMDIGNQLAICVSCMLLQ